MSTAIVGHRADIDTYAAYDRLPGVRAGDMAKMAKSPLHYRTATTGDSDSSTSSQQQNQAIHAMILEPENFERQFSVYAGKVRNGKQFDAHCEAWPGTTVLLESWMPDIERTARAVRNDPRTQGAFTGQGWSEVAFAWTDPATGLDCKARLDRMLLTGPNEVQIIDCKAIGTDLRDISRRVSERQWHVQAAHQIAGVLAHNPDLSVTYRWCCYETAAPYDVVMVRPADSALDMGEQTRQELLARITECQERDHWPGRHEGEVDVDVAPYLYPDLDLSDIPEE